MDDLITTPRLKSVSGLRQLAADPPRSVASIKKTETVRHVPMVSAHEKLKAATFVTPGIVTFVIFFEILKKNGKKLKQGAW
jgi:hypothetical protein